jgi:hypothetical protein
LHSSWERFAAAVLAAVMCVALAAGAHAQSDEDAYRELVRNALAEFDAKNWAESLALFRRAHAAQPSARTLRGLGMVAFEMQDYVEARSQLSAALRDPRKPLDGELRTTTEALLARTRQLIGRARITLEPASAALRFDGKRIDLPEGGELWMKAGSHVLIAEAVGHHTQRTEIDVLGGEDLELELKLEPALLARQGAAPEAGHERAVSESLSSAPDGAEDRDDDALTGKWWFWAGAGALAVGIGAAVVLLASGDEADGEVQKGTDGVIITTLSLP